MSQRHTSIGQVNTLSHSLGSDPVRVAVSDDGGGATVQVGLYALNAISAEILGHMLLAASALAQRWESNPLPPPLCTMCGSRHQPEKACLPRQESGS